MRIDRQNKGIMIWFGVLYATLIPLISISIPEQITLAPNNGSTATFPLTIQRAPCAGESTRTPTPTATITPTYDYRSPTPTATSTHYPSFSLIPLSWPPNCAVLHRHSVPDFQFRTQIGAPFDVTLYLSGPESRVIAYHSYPGSSNSTSVREGNSADYLPDGIYYWYVTSMKFESLAGKSETWVFRIDTSCGCTETPTSTYTPSATYSATPIALNRN